MRYAVLSDVHANYEALTAVLGAAREQAVESYLFLGDLVGYNADPVPCADAVFSLPAAAAVRGNHDKAAAGLMDLDWFNPWARAAVEWTRDHCSRRCLEGLRGLPAGPWAVGSDRGILICHGSPMDEDAYVPRDFSPWACFRFLETMHPEAKVCFFGHTHDAGGWCRSAAGVKGCGKEIRLDPDRRYLINPGSVGQPRDGIPEASFGIFDSGRGAYRNFRIAYDVETAQRKVLAAGLPGELAARLPKGR